MSAPEVDDVPALVTDESCSEGDGHEREPQGIYNNNGIDDEDDNYGDSEDKDYEFGEDDGEEGNSDYIEYSSGGYGSNGVSQLVSQAATITGKAVMEKVLCANIQEISDDNKDEDDEDMPELVGSGNDEGDSIPPGKLAPTCEPPPPQMMTAPLTFRRGLRSSTVDRAGPTGAGAGSEAASVPQPESLDLSSARQRTPYSNAWAGIRESVRPEPVQLNRPQYNSASSGNATAVDAGRPEAADYDDSEMPELTSDDEKDFKESSSSSQAGPNIQPGLYTQTWSAAAAQFSRAAAEVSAAQAGRRSGASRAPEHQQERSGKSNKESRKNWVPPSSTAPMSRSDFANDDAWQQHLAREREERKRLRRERGLVENDEQGAAADAVLGTCCLRPGNDTEYLCDEPGYKVKETQRRYHLQCTKGCSLLFHDKCWRPFADGMAQLRGDEFDRNFRANTKEGKLKLHRCVTDCCNGYICRVYISQVPELPGAKAAHELYSMDPTARQLAAAAEASQRRKRLAGGAESQTSASSCQQPLKKSRKVGPPAGTAAGRTSSTAARLARRAGRRREAAEAAVAATSATAGAGGAARQPGQEGSAQVEIVPSGPRVAASKGISIVVRARSVQKGELEGHLNQDVDCEAAGIYLDQDVRVAAAPGWETDASRSARQVQHADAGPSQSHVNDGNGEATAALPPPAAAAVGGGAKKKKKGFTMHLHDFIAVAGGGAGAVAAGIGSAVTAATAGMTALPINDEAVASSVAAEEGYFVPQPPASSEVRYSGFPTLSAAMEHRTRRGDLLQEDLVMEALSMLRLDERQGGCTNILFLGRLDVRFMEKQQPGCGGYLWTELEKYGGVTRLQVFRAQECAAVEMETEDVAYNVFVMFRNQTIGSRRPLVCFMREFPTEEVLSRHIGKAEDGLHADHRVAPDRRLGPEDTWAPTTVASAAAASVMPPRISPPLPPQEMVSAQSRVGTGVGRGSSVSGPSASGESSVAAALPPRLPRPGGTSSVSMPSLAAPAYTEAPGAGVVGSKSMTIPLPRKKILPIIDANTREVVNKEAVESVGSGGIPGTDSVANMAAAMNTRAPRSAAVTPGAGEASGSSHEESFAQSNKRAESVKCSGPSKVAKRWQSPEVTVGTADVRSGSATNEVTSGAAKIPASNACNDGQSTHNHGGSYDVLETNATAEKAEASAAVDGSPPLRLGEPESEASRASAIEQRVEEWKDAGKMETAQWLGRKASYRVALSDTAAGADAEGLVRAGSSVDDKAIIGANATGQALCLARQVELSALQASRGSAAVPEHTVELEVQRGMVETSRSAAPSVGGRREEEVAPGSSVQDVRSRTLGSSTAAARLNAEVPHVPESAASSLRHDEMPPKVQAAPTNIVTLTPAAESTVATTAQERPETSATAQAVSKREWTTAGPSNSAAGPSAPDGASGQVLEGRGNRRISASAEGAVPGGSMAESVITARAEQGRAQSPSRGELLLLLKTIMAGGHSARPLAAVASRAGFPFSVTPSTATAAAASTSATAGADAPGANPQPPQPLQSPSTNTVAIDNFWNEYDVVYVVNCETKYLETYLRHTFKIGAEFFPNWDVAVPPGRVALLLFNRDTDEVLGLWAAVCNDGTDVILHLVRCLPAISKQQFLASPAGGRVFPGLPYKTKSARASGQNAKDVLRVFAIHEHVTVEDTRRSPHVKPLPEEVPIVPAVPANMVRPLGALSPSRVPAVVPTQPDQQQGSVARPPSAPLQARGVQVADTTAAPLLSTAAAAPPTVVATSQNPVAPYGDLASGMQMSLAAATTAVPGPPLVIAAQNSLATPAAATGQNNVVAAAVLAPGIPPHQNPPPSPFRTPLMMLLQQRATAGAAAGAGAATGSLAASTGVVGPAPPPVAPPIVEASPLGAVPAQVVSAPNVAPALPSAVIRPSVVSPAAVGVPGLWPVVVGAAVRPFGVPVTAGIPTVRPTVPMVRPVATVSAQPLIRPPQPVAAGPQPVLRPELQVNTGQFPVRVIPAGVMMPQRPVVPVMMRTPLAASLGGAPTAAPGLSQAPMAGATSVAKVTPPAGSVVPEPAAAGAALPTVPSSAITQPHAARITPSVSSVQPQQPAILLLCPVCHQRKGGWILLGCKHMGPCTECCSDPDKYGTMYPSCWCGQPTVNQPRHKVHLA